MGTTNFDLPPPAPVLQDTSRQNLEAFFVNAGDLDTSREIKLTVEFPTHIQQDRPNEVVLYFKKIAMVLLSAHNSIAILNWDKVVVRTYTLFFVNHAQTLPFRLISSKVIFDRIFTKP